MIFDINNYKGKCVMHCKTEEEAREFCDYLHSIGKAWCNRKSYKNHTNWYSYKEDTCYNFNDDCYETVQYYIERDYTILKWSDFTTEFTKADLKDGMVVECANGDRYLVLNEKMITHKGHFRFEQFNDNLELKGYDIKVWAINKVYKACSCWLSEIFNDDNLTLIWERKPKPEPVEMTLEEVCKALGKEIKIVKG